MTPGEQHDAPAGPGLRERKKRETRIALSRATIRLCIERGWARVTVDDIAAAANVSPRTFRNYFSSKAEAVVASHLERMQQVIDDLRGRPADEPLWDAITHAVLAHFAPEGDAAGQDSPQQQRWREGLRVMLAEPALHGELVRGGAVAERELAEVIAERTGTDAARDVYPRLVASAVDSAIAVALEHGLRQEPPAPGGRVLDEVFALVRAGLPAPGDTRG